MKSEDDDKACGSRGEDDSSSSLHQGLMDHKDMHWNEKQYKCGECSKAYTHLRRLDRHKCKLPFKCDECGHTFSRCKSLYKHKRMTESLSNVISVIKHSHAIDTSININWFIHKTAHSNVTSAVRPVQGVPNLLHISVGILEKNHSNVMSVVMHI